MKALRERKNEVPIVYPKQTTATSRIRTMDESVVVISFIPTKKSRVPYNFFNGKSLRRLDGYIEGFNEREFVHVDERQFRRVITRKLDVMQNPLLRSYNICFKIHMLHIVSSLLDLEEGIDDRCGRNNSCLGWSRFRTKPCPTINRWGPSRKVQ